MMVLSLAWRNALRNVQRTLITAAMVVLGTALLVVGMAWMYGLTGRILEEAADQIGHVRVVDPDYVAREPLMPLYENLPDVAPIVEAVREVPGVVGAWPVISAPVTITAGEEIGDVFGLATGADPAWLDERMRLRGYLVEGAWFGEGDDEVIVGKVLADQAGLAIGGEVRIIGQTQDGSISPILGRVVGVAHAGNPGVDRRIYLRLSQMEWLTDIPGGAIEVLAYGDEASGAPDLAEAIGALPEVDGLAVQAWTTRDPFSGMLDIMSTVRGVVIGTIVLLTALGILNTMMMAVLERTHEIGVLRAMGLSRFSVLSLFVIEAMAIAALGGVLGVGLGSLGGWYLETYGITLGEGVSQRMDTAIPIKATLYGDLTLGMAVAGFVLGLVMALVGTLTPALRAAAIEPVEAMRSGR